MTIVTVSDVIDPTGKAIAQYHVVSRGTEFTALSYGCTITSVRTIGRDRCLGEVTLCFRDLDELYSKSGPYYGCIIGRVANRIDKGIFSLNNDKYHLAVNNGPNALHGGLAGFDKHIWRHQIVSNDQSAGVKFSYTSIDGEEGYPGSVTVEVTYLLTDDDELVMQYNAISSADTPINLTNHTYWNLSGDFVRPIASHHLQLSCTHMLPVSDSQIPTGEIRETKSTEFDFSSGNGVDGGILLGDVLDKIDGCGRRGLDHCFVVDGFLDNPHEDVTFVKCEEHLGVSSDMSAEAREAALRSLPPLSLRPAGVLTDRQSGRCMNVRTSAPGVQVYSGNWIAEPGDTSNRPFIQHNAICLEAQHFPDSVNKSSFPCVILRPGHIYRQETVYSFSLIDG